MNALVFASAAAVAALAVLFGTASAQLFPPPVAPVIQDTNNTISVTGTAETRVEPDTVMITLAVETTEETPGEALRANTQAMNAVLEALEQVGVPENDTSTAYFSITPNYDLNFTEFGPQQEQEPSGYTVANSIMIESANLSNVSDWLDAAVGAGANRIDGVFFTVSEERMGEIRLDLMAQAIDNARSKADALASALDVQITGIRAAGLSDIDAPPSPFSTRLEAAFDSGAAPPIIPGDQTVAATVTVIYEIG